MDATPTSHISIALKASLCVWQKMPQTSLLGFLTSSTPHATALEPTRKTGRGPPVAFKEEAWTHLASAEKSDTHQWLEDSRKDAARKGEAIESSVGLLPTTRNPGTRSDIISAVQNAKEEAKKQRLNEISDRAKTEPVTPPLLSQTPITLPHCPSITITTIQPEHLSSLTRLTTSLLPIKYPESFYTDVLSDPIASTLSRLALYTPVPTSSSPYTSTSTSTPTPTPIPIGWIRCSLEPYPEATSPPSPSRPIYNQIYIKALCLLAPYRSIGIATALLESILGQEEVLREHNVQFVFAHVWERNGEALEWYEKRGFAREGGLVEGYYRRLRPQGAWIVRREVG